MFGRQRQEETCKIYAEENSSFYIWKTALHKHKKRNGYKFAREKRHKLFCKFAALSKAKALPITPPVLSQ